MSHFFPTRMMMKILKFFFHYDVDFNTFSLSPLSSSLVGNSLSLSLLLFVLFFWLGLVWFTNFCFYDMMVNDYQICPCCMDAIHGQFKLKNDLSLQLKCLSLSCSSQVCVSVCIAKKIFPLFPSICFFGDNIFFFCWFIKNLVKCQTDVCVLIKIFRKFSCCCYFCRFFLLVI